MTKCTCISLHCPIHGRGGPIKPDGFAYRYADNALRFNHGETVNGCDPMEALPYYLGEPVVKGIPEEPRLEHDFRQRPSRISARRARDGEYRVGVGAWVLYEHRYETRDEHTLCYRDDWAEAYLSGQRIVALLDGRTVGEAEMKGKFVP
jgi:hypothetical protein